MNTARRTAISSFSPTAGSCRKIRSARRGFTGILCRNLWVCVTGNTTRKKKALLRAARVCTIKCRRTDLMPKRLKKQVNADLKPQKLSGTMAFMFESRYIIRPTEFAMQTSELQHEYFEVWQKLKKNFRP